MKIFWARDHNRLILAVLAIKAVVLTLIAIGYWLLPFCTDCHDVNFLATPGQAVTLGSAFTTWDAQHYLQLATDWYQPTHASNAFSPLFPMLVRGVSWLLFGQAVLAGWLVSTAASLAALLLLFRLVERLHDRQVAWRTVLLLLTFPSAFYFHLMYSEGVFLLVVLGAFWSVRYGGVVARLLSHILLPLTRPQGMLVLLSHLLATLHDPKQWRQFVPSIIGIGLGLVAYFAFMQAATGSAVSGFLAQAHFATNNSLENLLHPWEWVLRNFWLHDWTIWHGVTDSVLNRLLAVGFVVALPFLYRAVDRDLFWYTTIVGGVTVLSGDLVSWPRYLLMLFPLFLWLALTLKSRRAFVAWCLIAGALQVVLLLAHSQNYWVA